MSFIKRDEELIRKLIHYRDFIENKIKELEREIEFWKIIKKILDSLIIEKSFTTAYELLKERKKIRRIKIKNNFELCIIEFRTDMLTIKPLIDIQADNRLINKFLKEKIFDKFRSEDFELVNQGLLNQDQVFNYEFEIENGRIKLIKIMNVRSENRFRKIIKAVKWVFQKVKESEKAS